MDSKKNYFLPVITAILLLLFSCTDETNSDIIYDITPIYFNIEVINKAGDNSTDILTFSSFVHYKKMENLTLNDIIC